MAHRLLCLLIQTFLSINLFVGILEGRVGILDAPKKNVSPNTTILLPAPTETIHRFCYTMGYDTRNKTASWVYECLTAENLKNDVSRDNCQFKVDPAIQDIFRATLQDYNGSGYDRGHLAPAANHKASLSSLEETFYLSNIAPQNPQFNRGYWAKLEKHVRDLTKSYSIVHVYTGPLYLPKQETDGSKWIKYQVIGDNNVGVPTHFFKILILEKSADDVISEGYVLPNEPINAQVPIANFKTPIEKIEKASGILFSRPKQKLEMKKVKAT